MRGGETVANTIHLEGKFQLDRRYDVLDVVTNGVDSYCCVRANSGADVTDTRYWVLLAKGKDGKDAQPPKLDINDQGYFVINDRVTDKKAQGPAGDISKTFMLTDDTDLNFTVGNGLFLKTDGKVIHGPADKIMPFTVFAYGDHDSSVTQILHALATNDLYVRSKCRDKWTEWRQVTQWI